ncbi:hypothetical protein DENSPDRAFT_832398 [Dentipellis sp. KUC8613]|nr:hypothetical protein DENSPDRAFT_832398 [Dentipellis sp. KUC8613]
MADRMPNGYSMPPHNFNPALLAQQGQLHPQPQQQVDAQANIGGLTNPEHNRMWQQMAQQYANGEMNPQLAEMFRNQQQQQQQNMARMNAQMGQQQSLQQPFNLAPGSLQSSSSQGFHDPPHGQQVPPNFPGMGNGNMAQLQAAFNAPRNQGQANPTHPPLMQALQNQGNPQSMSRQLELMGLAHTQQMGSFVSRMSQPPHQPPPSGMSAMQGQGAPQMQGMFPSAGPSQGPQGMHASPIPAAMQGVAGHQQIELNGNKMSLSQLMKTFTTVSAQLKEKEMKIMAVKASAAGRSDVLTATQLAQLGKEADHLRGMHRRLNQVLSKAGDGTGQAFLDSLPPPQHLPDGRTNPAWLIATGHSPHLFTGPPKPGQAIQPSPSLRSQQPSVHPGSAPQRQIPTPHQQSMASAAGPSQQPGGGQMSPPMNFGTNGLPFGAGGLQPQTSGGQSQQPPPPQQFSQSDNQGAMMPQIQPLPEAKFHQVWKPFMMQHKLAVDERLFILDGRRINLHALHAAVFPAGGYSNVTKNNQWPIIAAKVGFAHFPGSQTDPARSTPQVAQHIQQLYKHALAPFDVAYVNMLAETRRRAMRQQQQQQQQQAQQQAQQQQQQSQLPTQPSSSQPSQQQHSPQQQQQQQQGHNVLDGQALQDFNMRHPAVMNKVMAYVHTSEAEMREQGVAEKFIAFVEQNREQLRRNLQSQRDFRGGLVGKPPPPNAGLLPPQNGQPALSPSQSSVQQGGQSMPHQQPQHSPAPLHPSPQQMHQQSQLQQQQQLQAQQAQAQQQQQQRLMGMNPTMQSFANGGSVPSSTLGHMPPSMLNGQHMQGNMSGPSGQPMQPGQAQFMMQQQNMMNSRLASGGRPPTAQQPAIMQQRLPNGQLRRPTPEDIQEGTEFIARFRDEWIKERNLDSVSTHQIPENQRPQYNEALGRLTQLVNDLDHKLPAMYAIMAREKREELIKKLVIISITARYQHMQSSMTNPRFVIDLNSIRTMYTQSHNAHNGFTRTMAELANMERNGQPPGPAPPSMPPQPPQPPPQPQPLPVPQHPPHLTPSIPPAVPHTAPQNRPVAISQPSNKRKASGHPSAPSAPTPTNMPTPPPAVSVSTPTHQASTPSVTAASPQTPKSPKAKAAPKGKAPTASKRRTSKAAPPAEPIAGPSTPAETKGDQKDSKPEPKAGNKRAREEETPADEAHPSPPSAPSPKRVKSDWDGPPSEEMVKRKEEVENINTAEDAAAFVEHMTELLKMASSGDGQDSLSSDISNSLDAILNGYDMNLDCSDLATSSLQPLSPPSSHMTTADPFGEFFDFSSYGLDDDPAGSKAPTPDLVPASSTNPSPGSGSEADPAGHGSGASGSSPHIADAKVEELGDSDPLRMGIWKEIDGGQSAYYSGTEWKWDQPMQPMEWAISTS